MTISFQYRDLTIELFDDPAFTQKADSPTSYHQIIQADEDKEYSPTSQHAIKVYRDNNLIVSAIILASGWETRVHSDTALVDDGNLIIRCANKVFSLTLPDLITNWVTEVDWATCFSLHRYQDTYISHGEISISRIDKYGKILWSYSGEDIFVCLYEEGAFEMLDTYIALTDFNGSTYKIDYDGNTLEHRQFNPSIKPTTVTMKPPKKWWQVW